MSAVPEIPWYENPPTTSASEEPLRPQDKVVLRLSRLATSTLKAYEQGQADSDHRNLDYYRGVQWAPGTPFTGTVRATPEGREVQNEIFPVVDAMTCALAMELPQVEFQDLRALMRATPTPETDGAVLGRVVASVYNRWAREDDLDETIALAVRSALLFDGGAVVKTEWDAASGRPLWVVLGPDEVFFDPAPRRRQDCGWAFQSASVHWDDFLRSCGYDPDTGETLDGEPLYPDVDLAQLRKINREAPPSALMERMAEPPGRTQERQVDPQYVQLIYWYDFRRGKCYHFLKDQPRCLLELDVPLANPFRRLLFNPVPGRQAGVSIVTLCAPSQQVINELVSSRTEVVRRLAARLLIDGSLFSDEKEWEAFLSSKTWAPSRVKCAPDRPLETYLAKTPEMPLSFDFQKHLEQAVEALRYTSGVGSFLQGQSENIRTAEEAVMVRQGTGNRLTAMSQKVVKFAGGLFEDARAYARWALAASPASGFNLQKTHEQTQADIPIEVFERVFYQSTDPFTLVAFSPLQKDEVTRRGTLLQLLPMIVQGPLAPCWDVWELSRKLAELGGLDLSSMLPREKWEQVMQAAVPQPAGAPGPAATAPPSEAPSEGPPEMPPELLRALDPRGQVP